MNKKQIMETIKSLAGSQGFYSRLLQRIEEDEEGEILNYLEEQNFKDAIDMIMFIEC